MPSRGCALSVLAPAGNAPSAALDEHRIAVFVRAVTVCVERSACFTQRGIVRERAQQIVVASARFVRAGKDGINHAQPRPGADPLVGDGP